MLFLAILSIIATCFFGARALKSRRRTRLAFYEEDCIPLFESIAQTIEGIEINYEKKPIIQNNLVLLKGCVANTGDMDIDKSVIHKPLTISLPQTLKWLKAKMLSSSPDVNVNYELPNPQTLLFTWDLLKPNEYFRFYALAEIPAQDNAEKKPVSPSTALRKNRVISHRISNLHSLEIGEISVRWRPDRGKIVGWLIPVLGGIGLIASLFIWPDVLNRVNYQIELNNGSKVVVTMQGKGHDLLILKEVGGHFRDEIKTDEFFTKYRVTPVIVESRTSFYVILTFSIIYLITGCMFLWKYFKETKREKKKLRMLEFLK
jgi:hypothetical protein